jgi:SAM-dependent methyltransferase
VAQAPKVDAIRVDEQGFWFSLPADAADDVVDVRFDGRRVWSFWLLRDSVAQDGQRFVAWAGALHPFLNGTTLLALVAHVTETTLFEQELTFGTGTDRIAVVNSAGAPMGLDKTNKLMLTFDTRSAEHVAPLLDSMENVLKALKDVGIEAFPVYGSLLGAVRGGKLIGHDSDADLGYVSTYTHPADVQRESFEIQRNLRELGYESYRYSGLAFRIDVYESDGSKRGLDVFGGFIAPPVGDVPQKLYMMGEVGHPFELDWIYPLGTTTLEGRTLPAPARPEKLLESMYGTAWKVPDPAYKFTTPRTTVRRLNGWFRGIRLMRNEWERRYSKVRHKVPGGAPSSLATYLVEQEGGVPPFVVDLGSGRGGDALWFARQGAQVRALDFVSQGSLAVQAKAVEENLDLETYELNLNSLRSWLSEGVRLSHRPGPRVVMARHLIDAQSNVAREATWRLCEMALRQGGRLYLDFVSGGDPDAGDQLIRPVRAADVEAALTSRGAAIIAREDFTPTTKSGQPGRPTTRMVAQWQS